MPAGRSLQRHTDHKAVHREMGPIAKEVIDHLRDA